MGISRLAHLYAVQLHTDAMGAAVSLGGITSQNIRSGTEIHRIPTSGEVYSRFASIIGQTPGADIGTLSIATALANIGATGLAINAVTNPGVTLYAYQAAQGSTRKTGSTHRSYNLQEGLIIPTRLRCSHRGNAELSYMILATYDGTNDPIVEADTVAVATASTDLERFTLGPITLESITFDQATEWELDFGINAQALASDSDLFPTFAWIQTINPTLTLRGLDPEWLKSSKVPRTGLAITHDNTVFALRKRANGGRYVADATAEHIGFTAEGLAVIDDAFNASGQEPGTTSLRVEMVYDGTNAPFTIDTTYALA